MRQNWINKEVITEINVISVIKVTNIHAVIKYKSLLTTQSAAHSFNGRLMTEEATHSFLHGISRNTHLSSLQVFRKLFGPVCHPAQHRSHCLLSFNTNQHTANLTPSSSARRGEDVTKWSQGCRDNSVNRAVICLCRDLMGVLINDLTNAH